jgi:hypothetical protein
MMKMLAVLLLLAACVPPAGAGLLSVGGRAGYADYEGDVLYGSGDVGADLVIGAQVQVSIAPRIAIEAAAEYFASSFDYSVSYAGETLSREVDFRDLALYATAKLTLVSLSVVPVHFYAGGGPNLHLLTTDIVRQSFEGAELPAEDNLDNASRAGYHVVAGADIGGLLAPLHVFVEARYAKLGSDPKIASRSAFAGFRLGF